MPVGSLERQPTERYEAEVTTLHCVEAVETRAKCRSTFDAHRNLARLT